MALGAALVISVAPPGEPCFAGTPPRAKAEDLKAAFLIKIVRFTRWPVPQHPLRLVVYGGSSMVEPLERAARSASPDDPVWVVRRARSVADCSPADIVVFDIVDRAELRRAARDLALRSTLTVGDGEDPAAVGCALTFFQDRARLRFALDPATVERMGLTVSSRLYELARVRGSARASAP